MSVVGLRLDGDAVTAVRLEDDGRWDARDGTSADVESWREWLGDAAQRLAVAASLPLYQRQLRFPFVDARKIQKVVPLELQEHLPGDMDAFARQTNIGSDTDGGFARVVLTEQRQVEALLGGLAPLHGGLRRCEPEALLMFSSAALAESQAYAWLTPRRTTLLAGPATAPTTIVSIPMGPEMLGAPAAAANWLHRITAALPHSITHLVLDGWGRDDAAVAAALAPVADRLAWQWHELPPQEPEAPAARVAWRAAQNLKSRLQATWDLAPRRPLISRQAFAHPLVRAVALPGLAATLAGLIAFGVGTRAIRAEAQAYRFETAEIMRRQFPSMRIVDPLRQMTAIVERGGSGGHAGAPMIERLQSFHSSVTASGDLRLSELRAADGEWLIKGEVGDFAGVDALKEGIATMDWPAEVEVQRAEQTVDKSAIRFQIAWQDGGGTTP